MASWDKRRNVGRSADWTTKTSWFTRSWVSWIWLDKARNWRSVCVMEIMQNNELKVEVFWSSVEPGWTLSNSQCDVAGFRSQNPYFDHKWFTDWWLGQAYKIQGRLQKRLVTSRLRKSFWIISLVWLVPVFCRLTAEPTGGSSTVKLLVWNISSCVFPSSSHYI